MKSEPLRTECLIVGGGPAGLTAAIYLARFRRQVIVIDSGASRAEWIPVSHNYPGFFNGIHGPDLLERLRLQAQEYGAQLIKGEVKTIEKDNDFFLAETDEGQICAKRVLIATGIVDDAPDLPGLKDFVYNGVIRFCPICDGYEATDKRVGILGPWPQIVKKALFLRSYTKELCLLPLGDFEPSQDDCRALEAAEVPLPKEHVRDIVAINDETVCALLESGKRVELDILYPAMGAKIRSDLIMHLKPDCNDIGCLVTDPHQQTSVPGIYAAGDVTLELSQISVATGQAAIAATAMHNSLPANPR